MGVTGGRGVLRLAFELRHQKIIPNFDNLTERIYQNFLGA